MSQVSPADTLTVEQRAAATSSAERLAIVAGAGTGKTSTLVARVRHLLDQGVVPGDIVVTTFTKAAAAELAERIDAPVLVSTVHSLCAQILQDHPEAAGRAPGFSIYDHVDQEAVLRDIARDLALKDHDKMRLATLQKHPKARATYSDRMREANAVDYDQLEELGLRALPSTAWAGRFEHVLVDEAQDINPHQWDLLQQLSGRCLTLVADPRQAIFGWRGGDSAVFRRFAASAEVVELTHNWRSGQAIVGLGNRIHASLTPLVGRGEATTAERVVDDEPAYVASVVASLVSRGHSPSSIVLLGRTWRSLWGVAKAVREAGVKVRLLSADRDPWETPTGRTLARWLLLHANSHDANLAALVARVLTPSLDTAEMRGLAHTEQRSMVDVLQGLQHLPPLAEGAHEASRLLAGRLPNPELHERLTSAVARFKSVRSFAAWWTFGRTSQDRLADLDEDVVPATTVHGAKGLEWPTVIVVGAHQFPMRSGCDEAALWEERCCFYVAVTRARERLLLTRPKTLQQRNSVLTTNRSMFLP